MWNTKMDESFTPPRRGSKLLMWNTNMDESFILPGQGS